MRPSNESLEKELNRYPEVRWDRFAEDDSHFSVFGWVDREDGKADFVLFQFDYRKCSWWRSLTTSSAKWSAEFAHRLTPHLSLEEIGHTDCQRVESLGLEVNAIKLKEEGCEPLVADQALSELERAIATAIDDYTTMMNTGHPLTKEEADLADTISGWNGKAPEAEEND